MNEDTYLKDNIKKCVDYVMNKNDEDKRRILTGIFQYNDYLLNEQLVVKVLNDKEKQEWLNNEMLDTKDKEIERLNNIIKEAREYIEENRVKATNYFNAFDGSLCMDKKYVDKLLEILKGSDKE